MKTTSAFIYILVAVGLFYTVINPHYAKVKSLQAEANQYSDVLDNVDELTKKRDELLLKYNSLPKSEVARIEKALPDNIDSVKLALDFDGIASKYGISIKEIKTKTQTNNSGLTLGAIPVQASAQKYDSSEVEFSFVATYDNFKKFMKDIETSLRLIDVKSVSFQSTENGLYDFNVTIDTYWLK